MSEKLRQFILFLGDALLLYVSLIIALSVRHQSPITPEIWAEHWPTFSTIFLVWIIVFYIAGLYTLGNIRNDIKFYVTASQALLINILLAVSFFYIFPNLEIAPKTILALSGGIFFGLFVGWRRLAHRTISATGLKRRTLVVGSSPITAELAKLLRSNPQLGYEIAAVLDGEREHLVPGVRYYKNAHQLGEIITQHRIATIVLDEATRDSQLLVRGLYERLNLGLEFFALTQFYENITKKVPLPSINHLWFLENFQESNKRLYELGKRLIDILFSALGLVASIILLPLVSMLLAATNGRPIFFTQVRLGKGGKPFRAIKLRTMVPDAEKNGPQWASENDPRVTPIGRFLRKTRMDELPQLLNVLKGEMSFVGPRPERPEFVTKLAATTPFYRERFLVRPGLTGWAQINFPYGATEEDAIKKLQYDLYYIKNRSLILDFAIILRTIKTVLSRGGR